MSTNRISGAQYVQLVPSVGVLGRRSGEFNTTSRIYISGLKKEI